MPLWVSSTRRGGLGVVEGAVAEHREEHVGSASCEADEGSGVVFALADLLVVVGNAVSRAVVVATITASSSATVDTSPMARVPKLSTPRVAIWSPFMTGTPAPVQRMRWIRR